jgi:hypothetical protein
VQPICDTKERIYFGKQRIYFVTQPMDCPKERIDSESAGGRNRSTYNDEYCRKMDHAIKEWGANSGSAFMFFGDRVKIKF